MDIDAMLAIEVFVVNEHALLVIFPGKETLRKRGTLIRNSLVRRNDCKLPRFKTPFNRFFRGISSHHAAAQDDRVVLVHVLRIHPSSSISNMKQFAPPRSRYQ